MELTGRCRQLARLSRAPSSARSRTGGSLRRPPGSRSFHWDYSPKEEAERTLRWRPLGERFGGTLSCCKRPHKDGCKERAPPRLSRHPPLRPRSIKADQEDRRRRADGEELGAGPIMPILIEVSVPSHKTKSRNIQKHHRHADDASRHEITSLPALNP